MQDVRPGGPPSTKTGRTQPTRLMGRFQCEALLQSEGLLETWRARVQGLAGFDRVFAVKCLLAGALTRRPRAAEDLLRTARALAALKDGRLATVMDSGLAPGSAFVATEFIHGVSLRALREYVHGRAAEEGGRPLSWPAVLVHLCAEIASALAAAHGAETPLTHGALAAGAVMVTPQGSIKLVDLGLFAAVHTPAEIAASPVRRPCAAPELTRGQAPGPASDMYALGALALELATGRERRASGKLDSGTSWSRVLASELQTLIRRLLSFEPGERPSAAEVEATLREAAALTRGIDPRGELGQLVRRVLHSNGNEPVPGGDAAMQADTEEPPAFEEHDLTPVQDTTSDHVFGDEPTQVLAVAEDGHPDRLRGILRDMRQETGEEGTLIDATRGHNTPIFGTPVVAAAPDGSEDVEGAVSWHPVGLPPEDAGAADASAETRIQAVPASEELELPPRLAPVPITARFQRVSITPANQPSSPSGASEPRAHLQRFEEFTTDVPLPAHFTPSGWHPAGNLDGPTETDTSPMRNESASAERRGARRRRPQRGLGKLPKVMLVLVAAAVFGAGLAATVRFVAGKPPATVTSSPTR